MENNKTETMNTQLELNDIALMVNIIYTASRRGAFEPAEFTIVGTLFEKLKSFLPKEETPEAGQDMEPINETPEAVDSAESNIINVDFTQVKA